MNKSVIDEYLVNLYFRLNGYITTSLIIHSSEWGQTSTDIDLIAIRHPYHKQDEREIEPSAFMQLPQDKSNKIDVVYCEIKNTPETLRFNAPIKSDPNNIIKSLHWLGIIPPDEIESLSQEMIAMFRDDARISLASTGITCDRYNFRALLCCPNLNEVCEQWALNSNEIFSFISRCLNPEERRESCSTRYNFNQWGYITSNIVRYFKENNSPNIDDLYKTFGLE